MQYEIFMEIIWNGMEWNPGKIRRLSGQYFQLYNNGIYGYDIYPLLISETSRTSFIHLRYKSKSTPEALQ